MRPIFVGNLDYDTRHSELDRLFYRYGRVERIDMKSAIDGFDIGQGKFTCDCRERYSGSDLRALCEEAAMMPTRELDPHNILTVKANQVRPQLAETEVAHIGQVALVTQPKWLETSMEPKYAY
ncbi:Serine/arginine-rich splicing factor RS31A [Zea mays]|uniref:Serine/arginine-rich splicing factor RS31A n=1 Tax=Zea mays TaxID=4577 RepID=A0A1D6EFB6_MAIZE|nr:Serine/arginine-rich splicing factor RS31A [Zea mays]